MQETIKDFKVGMAKADVTPELGCLLYGYGRERRAQRVMDRLEVGVVALEQNDQTILLVSAEVCALNRETCDEMRKVIAEATGVRWENILYAAIHTHSGPVTRTSVGWGEADMDYLFNKLVPATIEAAHNALASMQPALMGIGTIESRAGINRRQVTDDGQIILGQNPDGPYNPRMTVIHFKNVTGESIGSIVHFAAHPTAAGFVSLSITRDWPGLMIDRITGISGAPCMFINGAEGDVGPRLSNGRTVGDDSHVIELGLVAAADAEKAYRNIDNYVSPVLSVAYGKLSLPFMEPPTLEAINQKIADMGDPKLLQDTYVTQYSQLQKMKAVYESGQEFPQDMEIPQTVVALGDLALVPLCFEAFCKVALAIRDRSPYRDTLLLGLTQGSYAYLPTQDQIPYGGYEVMSFRAAGGSACSFVDNIDELMISQNVKLLQQMYR